MTLDLDKLESLHQSTTPGPWAVRAAPNTGEYYTLLAFIEAPRLRPEDAHAIEILGEDTTLYPNRNDDMAWIVAAHEAFPAMLDRIRELSDFLARTKDECSRLRSIVRSNNPLEFGS